MERDRKGRPRGQQGVAIVTVLLVLSILVVVGLGIATLGSGHLTASTTILFSEKAYQGAEAGAMLATKELYDQLTGASVGTLATNGGVWPASPAAMANDAKTSYQATVYKSGDTVTLPGGATLSVPLDHWYILSNGEAVMGTNTNTPIKRTVGWMLEKVTSADQYAAYAIGVDSSSDFKIKGASPGTGGVIFDAWNGAAGPYPSPGPNTAEGAPVASGTGIKADKGANFTGHILGDELKIQGQFTPSGTTGPGVDIPINIAFPTPSPQLLVTPIVTTVSLAPGDYYTPSLVIGSGGKIVSSGTVRIYSLAGAVLDGKTEVPAAPGGRDDQVQIYVQTGPVSFNNGARIHALVKAPSSMVTFNGDAELYGSVAGQFIRMNGTSKIHHDSRLGGGSGTAAIRVVSRQRL